MAEQSEIAEIKAMQRKGQDSYTIWKKMEPYGWTIAGVQEVMASESRAEVEGWSREIKKETRGLFG